MLRKEWLPQIRYRLQAAFEDEENEDALAAAFEESDDAEPGMDEMGVPSGKKSGKGPNNKGSITDKEFYKAMQKLKDRGTNAVPPKKSASAYIIFGKEVRDSIFLPFTARLICYQFNHQS